jgi:hypothetical protein
MAITGIAEKKVMDSAVEFVKSLFTGHRELKKRIAELESENAELRNGKAAFERLRSELVWRTGDDPMYWRSDGTGPYCQHCFEQHGHLIGLKAAGREGFYDCGIHNLRFGTKESREREAQVVQRPIRIKRRPRGPQGWMA